MENDKNSGGDSRIFIKLKKTVLFLMISIILLVVLIIGVSYLNANGQKNSSKLINVLGKQRMLIQLMAKEASRISVIQSAKTAPDRIESPEVLDQKLAGAKKTWRMPFRNLTAPIMKSLSERYRKERTRFF